MHMPAMEEEVRVEAGMNSKRRVTYKRLPKYICDMLIFEN